VDEAARVKLALSRGNSAAEAQEASFLHRRTEQPVERSSGSPTGTSMARAASRKRSNGRTAHA
jgi:hypothetical protein